MEEGMFIDILGVLISFTAVILFLSLIVTSLSQFTQATFRLRGRNLKHNLTILLQHTLGDEHIARRDAGHLLRIADPTIPEYKQEIVSRSGRFFNAVKGPNVSWIDPKELPGLLDQLNVDLGQEKVKKLTGDFIRMDPYLRKRFSFLMRTITFFWAFTLAFYFQLSAIDLLRDLSVNQPLREAYVAAAKNTLEKGNGDQKGATSPTTNDQTQHTLAQAKEAIAELNAFNIQPWAKAWNFYRPSDAKEPYVENWLGVLFTTILLMLGAPFWFEQLQRLVDFRDTLNPSELKPSDEETKSA